MGSSGSLAVLLPQGRFLFPRINASRHFAVPLPNGAGRSYRPFARPQRLPPLSDLHSRVNVPGLLLRALPASFLARSASSSPASTGLPQCGRLHRLQPVASPLAGPFDCFLCLHSPPGLLHPSGSKRSTVSAALRLAFRIRPISSRSPLTVLLLVLTADQRSWFATFPEACCSSNLLEPSSL